MSTVKKHKLPKFILSEEKFVAVGFSYIFELKLWSIRICNKNKIGFK